MTGVIIHFEPWQMLSGELQMSRWKADIYSSFELAAYGCEVLVL